MILSVTSSVNQVPASHVTKALAHAATFGYDQERSRDNYDALLTVAKGRRGYEDSLVWYHTARAECARLAVRHGISLDVAIAAVAACSPQLAWTEGSATPNLDVANHIIGATLANPGVPAEALITDGGLARVMPNGHGVRQTTSNILRTILIVRGGDIDTLLTGIKVRSFNNNLFAPELDGDVTNDTHNMRGGLGDKVKWLNGPRASALVTSPKCKAIDTRGTVGTYFLFADDVRAVARAHGLIANSAQAAIWDLIRVSYN